MPFPRSLALAALPLAVAVAAAAERLPVPDAWQVQPAVHPDTPPNPDHWAAPVPGKTYKGLDPKKFPGETRAAKDIHALWLRAEFTVPDDWAKDRVRLDFERLNGNAVVFVNGQRAGERLGPYGDIDVTAHVRPGANELLLFNTRDYTGVSRTFATDPLRFYARSGANELPMDRWAMGVDAPVWVVRRRVPLALADVWADTRFREGKIVFKLDLDAARAVPKIAVRVRVLDADGREALAFVQENIGVPEGASVLDVESSWANPHGWSLDDGYLYTASVALVAPDGRVLDEDRFPFGFREVWTEGRQLMLNGRPARFRVEWSSFGINEHSLSLLKLLGRNMIYYQSNPTGWYRDWSEVFHFNDDTLSMLDRAGVAVLLPVPPVKHNYTAAVADPAWRAQYQDEMARFMKRYRRHPSVLAWCVSMNAFNPRDAIHPSTLGKRGDYAHPQAKVLEHALATARLLDPTRLAYTHADGNIGDLASGNVYPNFAPVQEAEDWPERYAARGDMPWWACEFAAVYDGSYWKGAQFLLTEYAAIHLGPDAYARETDEQLERTVELSVHKNRRHGAPLVAASAYAPLYWDVQRAYVEAMDRAWRTWGVLGWHYFNFHVGYGNPPEFKGTRPYGRYRAMTEPVRERPDWANPQFDYHAKNMQPLLAYLAGAPVHTDKTHAWSAGEAIEKQIAFVFDGPGDANLAAAWRAVDADGTVLAQGRETVRLRTGDITFAPIRFTAPDVARRTDATLHLTVEGHGARATRDSFAFQIFPREVPPVPAVPGVRARLFDPHGKSAWVKTLWPGVVDFHPGDELADGDVLVIGREALAAGRDLPFSADRLRAGLRVLILEQKPEIWEALGFRNIEAAPRHLYPGMTADDIMDGLAPADLRYWRGSPDLVPEFKHARAYDIPLAPKSSNRNAVASTLMEIPAAVGFAPLLVGEFDLAYAPLLRYDDGQGTLLFSSLDFTGRVGVDPAATRLARNLLALAARPPARTAYDVHVNLPADELARRGLAPAAPRVLRRAPVPHGPLGRVVGPDLLRWRDALTVRPLPGGESDGLFLVREPAEGGAGARGEIFVQLDPSLLRGRYPDDALKDEAVRLSVLRLEQLVARVRTFAGASPAPETTERLLKVRRGAAFADLGGWFALGPFPAAGLSAKAALEKAFPGEAEALAGDTNPNNTWDNGKGRTVDFRTQAPMNPDGFVDLARALEGVEGEAVAYVTKEIESDTDRTAILRFGVDYHARLYVNGTLAYVVDAAHASPKPNQFRAKVKLKKGVNVLTFKILSGSKGFGFWANLSEPDADLGGDDGQKQPERLYNPTLRIRSPYEYYYW